MGIGRTKDRDDCFLNGIDNGNSCAVMAIDLADLRLSHRRKKVLRYVFYILSGQVEQTLPTP